LLKIIIFLEGDIVGDLIWVLNLQNIRTALHKTKQVAEKEGANIRKHELEQFRDKLPRPKKHITEKLQNPRLLQITFRTLRHWKATMEYHKTKDILNVINLLGHKSI
jgi:hypothetical protein